MSKKIFAFDLGKASIGYCSREGHDIKEANSIVIDKDHSDISSLRDRRRVSRTTKAHHVREDFFNKLWTECGLEILAKKDKKFTGEFCGKKDNTIYTSCLLRIALLQNKPLEQWQIYKALYNALQRRGYDPNLAWKTSQNEDDKENLELIEKYSQENGIELINSSEYKYPCYYDAIRLGLWSESSPSKLKTYIPTTNILKVRSTNYVAPRSLVEKELAKLWENAQKQIPQLKKYSTEYFLYGEYREAYGSYVNPDYRKFMGTENDWQGVLGQKIPRFNNRIIAKCKLLPKRNVCKAETLENVSFVLLMKLKNLRFTSPTGEKCMLSADSIKEIYNNWLIESNNGEKLNTTITKTKIEKVIGFKILDNTKNINDTMKVNLSGRSSFCRRACQIMNKIILDGIKEPKTMDVAEFIDNVDTPNGITEQEIRTMLSKIGTWDNLYIPDNRNEMAEMADDSRTKTDIMIGNITNAVVRNRLQIFRDLLLGLKSKYGTPDEVIFEFVRDGADNSLYGQKKASDAEKYMKAQEKENEIIKKELEEQNALSGINFEKLKLLKMQGGKCIYSGQNIGISDFDKCEIDHIYPRTMGGNDALYNRVLCYRIENQNKKGRTPYEWLSQDKEKWATYVNRLNEIKQSLGKKKFELLTSKPEDCAKIIDSYNGLAETAHIARVAQQITAFVFGWGLQVEGENRHIFVNNGSSTFAIRKRYHLNSLLGDDEKKNRSNDKHHALDAICISYSRDFKYDEKTGKDTIDGFNPENVKKVIDEIIPYPYTNKKPFKGNTRPEETIYGLRKYGEKTYITKKINITSIEQKDKKIKTIIDEVIKNDLLNKLEEKMSANEWVKMLETYNHPKKQTLVKKVMVVVSEGKLEKDSNGRERIGEYTDFGTKGTNHQFKRSKGHKGQILYFNEKGSVKVMPVYANKSTKEVREQIEQMGCKLYNNGELFYSGCLINVLNDFEANVYYIIIDAQGKNKLVPQKEFVKSGIFKVRTIMSDGTIKLENNSGQEILTSASVLVSKKFKKYKED